MVFIELNVQAQFIDDLLIYNNTSNIIEKRWDESNGITSNTVLKINQTKNGYLFISTYHGISLFNGKQFQNYTSENLKILKENHIVDFCVDSTGTFFIATQNNIIIYNKNFSSTKYSDAVADIDIKCINIDKKGTLWIAAAEGLYRIIDNKLVEDSYFANKNGETTTFIYVDNINNIWIGTSKGRLYKYNGKKYELIYKSKKSNSFTSAVQDKKGNYFFASKNGIFQYSNDSIILLSEDIAPVNQLTLDKKDRLWLASSQGVFHYDKNTNKFIKIHIKKEFNKIQSIFFDSDHNLWLGTYREGLIQIRIGVFQNINLVPLKTGDLPTATLECSDGSFWIGSDKGDVYELKNNTYRRVKLKTDLRNSEIKCIFADSKQNKWICSYYGLLRISPNGSEKLLDKSVGFDYNSIRAIVENDDGSYWIATGRSGLIRINEKLELLNKLESSKYFKSNFIMTIVKGNNNTLLVATKYGMYIVKNQQIVKHYNKQDLSSNLIFNIYQDTNNTYWLATEKGVSIIKNDKIYTLNKVEELANNAIFDIVEDDLGYLWLPSKKGIYRIKKSEALDYIKGENKHINNELFNKFDGLFSQYVNASKALKTSSGDIVLNTKSGISILHPASIKSINSNSHLIIKSIIADHKNYLNVCEKQKIAANSRYLEINYDYIDFINSEKVDIYYQLHPFDYKVRKAKSGEKIMYTNLPADNYRFELTAKVKSELSKDLHTSIKFIKLKPWYEQFWFKVLVVISTVSAIWIIYAIRLKNITKQKETLEKEVSIRTTKIKEQKEAIEKNVQTLQKQTIELKEANSAKDKMFSIIGHDLKNPVGTIKILLDLILSNQELANNEDSYRIFKSMQESLGSTYQLLENLLLWARSQRNMLDCKPKAFKIKNVINESILLTKELAVNKAITIETKINADYSVVADKNMITTVIRNLLSNAIKFTHKNGLIIIEVSQQTVVLENKNNDMIEIKIIDNGIGIDSENINKINDNNSMILSTQGTNKEQGSGLGIGICIDFLQKHNKKLFVSNNKYTNGTSGSTFKFYLDKD